MANIQRPLQFTQIVLILLFIIMAWPVTVTCGATFQTCTPPPNEKGEIIRPVTIEPFVVVLLENALQVDLNFSYTTSSAIDRPVLLPE